jgi:hypothetical protein
VPTAASCIVATSLTLACPEPYHGSSTVLYRKVVDGRSCPNPACPLAKCVPADSTSPDLLVYPDTRCQVSSGLEFPPSGVCTYVGATGSIWFPAYEAGCGTSNSGPVGGLVTGAEAVMLCCKQP